MNRILQIDIGLARRVALLALLLAGVLAMALPARPAQAHAFLAESTPAANAVLPTAPDEVTVRFTEPLETSYSKAELFDATGAPVADAPFRFGPDGYTMLVTLPDGLPLGTYSVLWRTLSTADGHTAQGYVPFTIGSDRNVAFITPPAPDRVATGAPEVLRSGSRWFALMTLAATVAIWPIWVLVLRPAISPAWQAGPALTRRARKFAGWAIGLALLANVLALAVQAMSTVAGGGFLGSVVTTLTSTRYGTLWLVRVGLLLVFAAAMLGVSWWRPWQRKPTTVLALAIAALLPLPFSLVSHAAAQPAGAATAVAFDMAHLLGASLWIGGVFVLLAVMVPTLNLLTPAGRQVVLGQALPRFSTVALAAWAVMLLTGAYQGLLEVGSLGALTTTPYGQTLMIKFALLLPLLALGAFNLLVVTRKIRQATDEASETGWSGNFVTAIAAEALLVTLLVGAVGMLIGQPPAREEFARTAGQVMIPLSANGQEGRLYVNPGSVGPNHYRLELGSGHEAHLRSPYGTTATLRFELPSARTGIVDVDLVPAFGGAFEGHGSELSIEGDWSITTMVRAPGQPDWDVTSTFSAGPAPPPVRLPAPPPRFGVAGIAGLALLVGGCVAAVWAVMQRSSPMRREATGLGVAALAVGALILMQARLPATLAAPVSDGLASRPDMAAVVRGEPLFAANCATCHGARGQGDGPQAGSNGIVPANLTVSHARAHSDEVLAYWIRNGIAGSKMPGFPNLSDDQVADIVAYVRDLQFDALARADAPGAEGCLVQPRSLDAMRALAQATPAAGVPAPPAPPPATGDPVSDADLAGIKATIRELVACSNAGDTMRRLALYSDDRVRQAYPDGPTTALSRIAGTPIPVIEEERVALLDISDARKLEDGRVAARVTIDNPQFHTHGPATPTANTNTSQEAATLVFVQADGRWLIDAVSQ